jgi:hydroxymethylpyrimidine pyrophosphatase-like HAD family hydrolase
MNPTQFKILFQDVDGCLNPANGEPLSADPNQPLSTSQLQMLSHINAAIDASPLDYWVINSGRYWPIFKKIAEQLPTKKLRYFLFEHACVLYDRELDQNLDLSRIAMKCHLPELAQRYANMDTMQRLLDWYDTVGEAYMSTRFNCAMPRLDKLANLSFEIPSHAEGDQVLAEVEARIRQSFSAQDCAQFEFARSDRFIDILFDIHKLDGIELVCAYLAVPQQRALAMGDYLNDLAVFESFAHVLCPANAHPRIIELTRQKGEDGHVSKYAYGAALLDFLQREQA